MIVTRLLLRLFLVPLFMVFGSVAGFALPGDWSRVSYPIVAQDRSPQSVDLTNTARAPPHTSANLTSTGAAFTQYGDLRALDGAETTRAAYAYLRSTIAPSRPVIDVSDVRRGTPEYEALNNPPPNTTAELSNGTTFRTGEGGYVDEVTYQPVNSSGVRDGRQTAVGREGIAGDVGGHIQACRHGGTCDRFNLFPQNSNFNNSAYRRWENEITRSLQNGDDVGNVTVRLNRADPHNPRPDSVRIEYSINGETRVRNFRNEAGG